MKKQADDEMEVEQKDADEVEMMRKHWSCSGKRFEVEVLMKL